MLRFRSKFELVITSEFGWKSWRVFAKHYIFIRYKFRSRKWNIWHKFWSRKNIQLWRRFGRFFLKFLKFYWNAEIQVQIRVGHHEWIWLKITESIRKILYFQPLQAQIQKMKYLAPIWKRKKISNFVGDFVGFS